ncbi:MULTISPECIES: PAS domain S-box protein [unclassified Microcoleus]|uniref:PAS domain S-box protein n=1 Tax=unclassified Microcoleus TaxID=2642155 RepID=UPI002FD681BB
MEFANLLTNLRSPLAAIDRHPVTVAPSTSVGDAIALMRLARNPCPLPDSNATVKPLISCVLVVEENQLVGLLSQGDMLNLATESGWQEMKVVDAMTRNLIVLKESEFTDIFSAFKLFCQHSIDCLPIVDEQGQLIGLVSEEKIRPEIYSVVKMLEQEVVKLQQKQCDLLKNKSKIEKQVSDRKLAETALQQFNVELEQRVQQRTEHYKQAVLTGKLTAEKLQNSEAELLALFNAMTDIVLVFDASGRYLKVAPTSPQLLYKRAVKALGKTLAEMLPEAEANFCLSHIHQTLASGETHRVEYSMEIGGKLIWFDGSISPLGVDRVIWVARDITARKHAEAALQKSEEKFRNLFDDAPIAIGLASVRDYRMIKVNEAHRQMLGYGDVDWAAMSFADVTHSEDLQAEFEQIKQLVDGNISRFQMEKRLTKKNGELMWANLTVTLIRDRDGIPVYSMGAIEDISCRKRAEMELQQLKERLQFLLASNPAVIFTATPTGNFCITYISDNVKAIVGYDPQEVLADSDFWSSRIHPEDRAQFIVNFSDLSERKNCICEYRFLHGYGFYRWLRTELKILVNSSGIPIEIIGYAADISNSKCAEIALRQQFEQERLVEAIARRVRQSLQLEEILNTTVAELQQVLLADRVLVYQILPEKSGRVIAEAVAEGCSPLVDRCFGEEVFPVQNYQLYLQGRICALSELDHPSIAPCMVEFLKQIKVRAKLVVPIIQHSQLWGLLIAHQCDKPREWQEWEINLFHQLVNQLAIAIQQSLLYQQLQTELSDRKQAEANLKNSLKEKEILLKEIHHRVKNNLCVVASLLELQSNTVAEPQIAKMFEESQNRLYSMALIHEKLYRSTNLAQINFGEYLEDLVSNLFHSYNISDNRIQLQVLAEPISLNIETATPCGLIANELVSNTLKHAFPHGTSGTVSVECYQTSDGEIHLFVKDNGVGFPQNLDFRKTNSMGFQVVCTLTEQLEGTIELSRQIGTAFHLTFNELNYSQRL